MQLIYTTKFAKSVKKLPKDQQRKLTLLLSLLAVSPFSPMLHTKPLTGGLVGFYSFRITREWIVLFQLIDPKTIELINVAHRKDIYR